MKTRLPISTISFNTKDFLVSKLQELTKNKILSEWYFIKHKGEDDEAGKREHFHVYMMPSKQLQTDDLRDEFKEYDPTHPDKPRKCLSINSSKFPDFYMYALHDKVYLASKGQTRKYHYLRSEFVSFDEDILNERVQSIDLTSILGQFHGITEAQRQGLTFQQYFKQGQVPIQQINQFQQAWNLLLTDNTNRNGKPGHLTQTEDGVWVNENGEIIETE